MLRFLKNTFASDSLNSVTNKGVSSLELALVFF